MGPEHKRAAHLRIPNSEAEAAFHLALQRQAHGLDSPVIAYDQRVISVLQNLEADVNK